MSHFTRWTPPLLLLLMLALAGTGCTAKLKAKYHQQRADHYFEAGRYDQAEIEYKNVLRNAPQNAQARGRLGLIFFEEGRLGEAAQYLNRAKELGSDDLQVRLSLGTINLGLGKYKEARAEADYILNKDPRDVHAPILLAESAMATNDIAATRLRLQKMVSAGDSAPLEIALGSLSFRGRDLKTAETCFQAALRLDPKFDESYSAIGNFHLAQRDVKQADQAFEKAMELSAPRSGKALFYAQFKILTGDPDGGGKILEDLVKQVPDYLPAWIALAQLAGTKKDFAGGLTLLGNVFSRDPRNAEALFLKVRLEMEQGNNSQAIDDLEAMKRYFPNVPMVYYQLAKAQAAINKFDQANENLAQALKLSPNYEDANVLLAEIQIYSGNADVAITSLRQMIRREPQFVPARFLLARAYSDRGRFDEAVAAYRDLETAFPTNSQVRLLLGNVFYQQKKNAEAREEYEQALKVSPNYLPAVEKLVDLNLLEKQYDAAHQLVQQQIAQNPKAVPLQLLLAQVQIARGETNEAEGTLKTIIAQTPEAQPAYLMLARLYVAANQHEKAQAELSAASARNPNDPNTLLFMGETCMVGKNFTGARDAYEKLLTLNTNNVYAMNNLAWIYSEQLGQLDKGYQLAKRARDLSPTDPNSADTLGWILCHQGQFTPAVSLLRESAAKLDSDPSVQFHLGKTYYLMGDEVSARVALNRALQPGHDFSDLDECKQCLAILDVNPSTAGAETRDLLAKRLASQPKDTIARLRLAAIYQLEGSLDKAMAAYEATLQASPQNVTALVNLAGLMMSKDQKKAYNLAKAAYDLTPNDPVVTHTMGRLAFQTGDYVWALNLLQLTARSQGQDPELLYDLGRAYYSVGKVPEAQSAMQSALQAGPNFSQAEDARRYLDMSRLAEAPAQALAAESQVAGVLKSAPDFVPALMVQAVISEQKSNLSAAQQTYEAILNHYPDFFPAQKKLLMLYVKDPKNDNKASALAVKARQASPRDSEVAKALGLIVYRQGDYARTVSLLTESAHELNRDPELLYYLGLAQYQLKNRAQAKTALQQSLDLNLSGSQATDAKRILADLK